MHKNIYTFWSLNSNKYKLHHEKLKKVFQEGGGGEGYIEVGRNITDLLDCRVLLHSSGGRVGLDTPPPNPLS